MSTKRRSESPGISGANEIKLGAKMDIDK